MFDTLLLVHQAHTPVSLNQFRVAAASVTPILDTYDCGPDPIEIPVDWGMLDGVDGVETDTAVLRIGPPGGSATAINLGELAHHVDHGTIFVEIPPGHQVRKLHLADLVDVTDGDVIDGASDLSGGWRLAVTPMTPDGRFLAPAVTVPAVGASGQRDAMFVGGSLVNGVLTLPDLEARTIRIALVNGDAPEFPEFRSLAVGTITGWAAPAPRDLTVHGPDGATLWSFPGTLPGAAYHAADLTIGVQGALDALLAAHEPLTGAVTITAARPGKVGLGIPTVRGALLRSIPGTTKATLAGGPVAVVIDPPDLPPETPSAVVADVHVHYEGIRLAEISDLLPDDRAAGGVVVGDAAVVRPLPPAALRGEQLARVGLVGRAPAASAMSIQIVDASPGAEHAPLAAPAVVAVDASTASDQFGVVWARFEPPILVDRPIGISATVTEGAFWWVADPEPLVRLAIVDPEPGGRPVLLAGQTLLTLDTPTLAVDRAELPGAGFTGVSGDTAPLEFASALYCTVELTDLTLRYARPGP